MLVIIATRRTQGALAGDYCWALEGELVTPIAVPCGAPDTCGCGRGFLGLASDRATTTALVVDRPDIDERALRDAVRDALGRQGWLSGLSEAASDGDVDDVLDEHLHAIATVCDHFEVGAVLGRRDHSVFIRALTSV